MPCNNQAHIILHRDVSIAEPSYPTDWGEFSEAREWDREIV